MTLLPRLQHCWDIRFVQDKMKILRATDDLGQKRLAPGELLFKQTS